MVFGRRKKSNMGLLALAGETAKMAKHMMVLDKTEAALEKELEREEHNKPKSTVGNATKEDTLFLKPVYTRMSMKPIEIDHFVTVRHIGENVLHSKYLLLLVVIFNILDCLFVMGELMLDIQYVTDLLTKEYSRSEMFVVNMKVLYHDRLDYLHTDDIELLEQELLVAEIMWKGSNNVSINNTKNAFEDCLTTASPLATNTSSYRRKRSTADGNVTVANYSTGNYTEHVVHHSTNSIAENVGHGLHKASIAILGILVVETFIKVFCVGKELVKHRLECFDAFIVIASFIVDLVFLKGLQQFTVQQFVLILAFLVPWRIIRVVNSMVVAILNHEHFRLKLLYKQKKKVAANLQQTADEIKGLQACIHVLEKMCEDAGLPRVIIKAKLEKERAKNNVLGALSNFALGQPLLSKPEQSKDQDGKKATQKTIRKQIETSPGHKQYNVSLVPELQNESFLDIIIPGSTIPAGMSQKHIDFERAKTDTDMIEQLINDEDNKTTIEGLDNPVTHL